MQTASGTPQANTLRLARVVKSYPDKHVVDVVFLDDGGFASGVGVSNVWGSQSHGIVYMPEVEEPADGHWSVEMSNTNDCLALVGYFSGLPFAVGFCFPAPNEMGQGENMMMFKHISGSSISIDGAGNITVDAVSRAWIKLTTGTGAKVLIGVKPGIVELN